MRNHEALKALYRWMVEKSSEYEDGDTGVFGCMETLCRATGVPEEVGEWAAEIYAARSAWESGIPLTVINERTFKNCLDLYLPAEEDDDDGSIAEG